jgi:hypothetical protein
MKPVARSGTAVNCAPNEKSASEFSVTVLMFVKTDSGSGVPGNLNCYTGEEYRIKTSSVRLRPEGNDFTGSR